MNTPNPKYFCPRCRAAFDVDSNYCGRCGADMHRASRLQRALLLDEESSGRVRASTDSGGGDDSGPVALGNAGAGAPRDRRASTAHDPWLGRVVDSRYRVIDVVGRGGMGVVYKVEHQRMGKIAAMKVLHRDLAGEQDVIERFHREAEAVSRLTHPNTVQVFDFGTAQGALYLVMEYVRGLDLGSLLDRDGPMPFERGAPLFGQVCAALFEAHEIGIVHRDLKPENILVTRTHRGKDFVKVLDFGLAKLAEREEVASVTGRGSIVGTPYYMSPEQIRGDDVDARSDIYSLGALMYRVLTEDNAFSAATPVGVLTKHLTEPVEPPSRRAPDLHLPLEVDDIVLRAMQKQRTDRYQSVGELVEELEAAYQALYGPSASGKRRPLGLSLRGAANPTPRTLEVQLDDGLDDHRRLRRADLDAFERSLVRRRWTRLVLIPLALAAAAAGGYLYYDWRGKQPRTAEEEPNGQVGAATPIRSGVAVTGHIGRRESPTRADRDYFALNEVPAPGGGQELSVELSGLPNMDLVLRVYQPGGHLVAERNEGSVGDGEVLHNLRVRRPVVVMATEAPTATGFPTENVSDQYRLSARLEPTSPVAESEPNDTASDAGRLEVGAAVHGWLDRRDDVDLWKFAGPAGRYRIQVAVSEDLPLVWLLEGVEMTAAHATAELATGDRIELLRGDRWLPRGERLPAVADPYRIEIHPAP